MPSDTVAKLNRARGERLIVVATMQAVAAIQRDNQALYAELGKTVSAVLVDEGHREPAPTWARSLRNLDKPIILFSATPYRNDLRHFIVDSNYIAQLSFDSAAKAGIIREVSVERLERSETAAAFARALVRRVQKLEIDGDISAKAKVIIHCETAGSVSSVHDALLEIRWARDAGVLAFHETFSSRGPTKYADVPRDLRELPQRFLVHQYKLLEGIDEPAVQVLGMYESLSNARSLVQQVGRIVRNPSGTRSVAFVLCSELDILSDTQWKGFRDYDRTLETLPKTDRDVVANLLRALPPFDYFKGAFRKRVPEDFSTAFDKELRIRKSALIYHHPAPSPEVGLAEVIGDIRESLVSADRWIAREMSDGVSDRASAGYLFLAVIVAPSRLLQESAFVELRFTATAVRQVGNYLFISDSESGAFLDIEDALAGGDSVRLDSLLSGVNTRLTGMSAINSDIGPRALRSRSGAGYSLGESAPYLADHQYVLHRIQGYSGNDYRALGLVRNRVTSGRGDFVSVKAFATWTGDVALELASTSGNDAHPYVERFAKAALAPKAADAEPLHILLHIEALTERFESDRFPGKDLADATELANEVLELPVDDEETGARHAFEIEAFGVRHEIYIKYVPQRRRYKLYSPFLDSFVNTSKPQETALAALNMRQAFQVIPACLDTIYVGRRFYRVDLSVEAGGRGRLLLDLLMPVPALAKANSEKGDISTAPLGRWSDNSAFDLIDRGLKGLHGNPFGSSFPLIACTDLGREIADFVAVDEKRSQLVFLHAKAGSSLFSVSALHVVVAQAIKNLANATAASTRLSEELDVLKQPWRQDGQVRSRMRSGSRSAFVRVARQVSANPNGQREVWLVLGNLLSRSRAEAQLKSHETSAQVVQMFMLLSSLYTQCVSVGVRLRVYCSP
jgi:hypothetical protein